MRNVAQQNSSKACNKQIFSQTASDKTLSQLLPTMCFSAKAHEAVHQEEMPLSIGPELGMQVGLHHCVHHRRGQAPTRGELCCVVAPSCSLLPFMVKPATLASPDPFPFGSHLQLCLSCNPNLLSQFHASHYKTTFHQNTFLINKCWIWSRLGENVQLIWVGGGSIFVVFFSVRNVPRSCEA